MEFQISKYSICGIILEFKKMQIIKNLKLLEFYGHLLSAQSQVGLARKSLKAVVLD